MGVDPGFDRRGERPLENCGGGRRHSDVSKCRVEALRPGEKVVDAVHDPAPVFRVVERTGELAPEELKVVSHRGHVLHSLVVEIEPETCHLTPDPLDVIAELLDQVGELGVAVGPKPDRGTAPAFDGLADRRRRVRKRQLVVDLARTAHAMPDEEEWGEARSSLGSGPDRTWTGSAGSRFSYVCCACQPTRECAERTDDEDLAC